MALAVGCSPKRRDEGPPSSGVGGAEGAGKTGSGSSLAGAAVLGGAGSAGAGSGAPIPPSPDGTVPGSLLPVAPGLPPPYDRFRPHMKEADVLAAIVDAGIKPHAAEADLELPNLTTYATAIPGVVATFDLDGDRRLSAVTFHGPASGHLRPLVLSRWGDGAPGAADPMFGIQREWPPSADGWRASLTYPDPHPDPTSMGAYMAHTTAMLRIERADNRGGRGAPGAAPTAAGAGTVTVTSTLWSQLGPQLGAPLESASAVLGRALLLETDDRDDAVPSAERPTRRQGYARLATPWSTEPWELVLHVDPATGKIADCAVTGTTDDEAARVALFASLRAAFGTPKTAISEAGRIEIAFATPALELRIGERSDTWMIVLRAR